MLTPDESQQPLVRHLAPPHGRISLARTAKSVDAIHKAVPERLSGPHPVYAALRRRPLRERWRLPVLKITMVRCIVLSPRRHTPRSELTKRRLQYPIYHPRSQTVEADIRASSISCGCSSPCLGTSSLVQHGPQYSSPPFPINHSHRVSP